MLRRTAISGVYPNPTLNDKIPGMIAIREIRPDEVPAARRMILGIAYRLFGWEGTLEQSIQHFEQSGALGDMDDVQASYIQNGGLFLLALDGENMVGTGAIRRLDASTAEIKRLWLMEEYQRQGIGFKLMTRLLDFARQCGYGRVRLVTDARQGRAIGFYNRMGFYQVDAKPDDVDDIVMELIL
jgi:putative acetyltransferase